MAKSRVTITGGAELQRKLKALGALTQAKVLENAVIAGALPILNEAIDSVAVKSGTLKRSLHIGGHTDASSGFAGTDMGVLEQGDDLVVLGIGTDVEYAARIEFGFSGQDSLGRNYDQPAKPYLRPAWDTKQAEAVGEMGAALKQQLDHLVG